MKKVTMKELSEKAQATSKQLKQKVNDSKLKEGFSEKMKSMRDLPEKAQAAGKQMKKQVSESKLKNGLSDKVKTIIKKDTKISKEPTSLPLEAVSKRKGKRALPRVKEVKPRVIKEKKNYHFVIMTKDITNPRSRKIMKALQSTLYEYDCTFMVCAAEGNAVIEDNYITMCIEQKIHALIVETCANASGIAKRMDEAGITCVFLNNKAKGLVSLAVNEAKAGETLGAYTMEYHHLIIRYLGADEALSSAHFEGLKKVYHDKNQPLDYTITMSDGSHLDTYDKLKEIFEEKIDLLLLERDEMAIPLNKFLKEYHIAVPQNTSVISYGGHAITQVMSPTLTSLAFDYSAYANYVCTTLFALLESTTKPKMPVIYHIQEGDSVR